MQPGNPETAYSGISDYSVAEASILFPDRIGRQSPTVHLNAVDKINNLISRASRFFRPFAAVSAAVSAPVVAAQVAQAGGPHENSNCQYVLGFATLEQQIPGPVGDCIDNQSFAPNGDAVQHTSGGLLVWRKADNWTAFTDGFHTWVNGPNGVQERLNTERFAFEGVAPATAPTPDNTPKAPSSSIEDIVNDPKIQYSPEWGNSVGGLKDLRREAIQSVSKLVIDPKTDFHDDFLTSLGSKRQAFLDAVAALGDPSVYAPYYASKIRVVNVSHRGDDVLGWWYPPGDAAEFHPGIPSGNIPFSPSPQAAHLKAVVTVAKEEIFSGALWDKTGGDFNLSEKGGIELGAVLARKGFSSPDYDMKYNKLAVASPA